MAGTTSAAERYPIDPRVQLSRDLIVDVVQEITRRHRPRILIFGLGYDTPMWQHFAKVAGGTVVFVEENEQYIKLNPTAHVIKVAPHQWHTYVGDGTLEPDANLLAVHPSLAGSLFDVILVDGPTGYGPDRPGRQGACRWAALLSAPAAAIYIDDSERPIEAQSIVRYFHTPDHTIVWNKVHPTVGKQCTKILQQGMNQERSSIMSVPMLSS
jgi:hypothetical protein